jgi:hypothetical protein
VTNVRRARGKASGEEREGQEGGDHELRRGRQRPKRNAKGKRDGKPSQRKRKVLVAGQNWGHQ